MFQVLGFKNRGFTLIEIIVSMAVFLLVAGMAVSIFISIVTQQRRILSEQQLINQTSYVLEYMSKALRMAGIDDEFGSCIQDDFGGVYANGIYVLTRQDTSGELLYKGIRFKDASAGDICHEFFLDVDEGVLKEIKSSGGFVNINTGDAVALTSERIKINSIEFRINGESGLTLNHYVLGDDDTQPRITIFMEVQIPGLPAKTAKKIQTTVSLRNLNIE